MNTYRDLIDRTGQSLTAASASITAYADDSDPSDAAAATWALAAAQVAATLAIAESIQELTKALRHLEGGLQS